MAGSDFGSKINYQLKHSEAFYSGKYPQYNTNDTIFNNIDDFGKLVALNSQERSFRNSGNSILLGLSLGGVVKIKNFLITVKSSFCQTNSSFKASGNESALPLFSNMPYNSVLLRTNYLNYNTIAFNIGLNYFL
jgi:hypothetical protein